jgi:lipopolysaccharide transport system ATP-binding protein
LILPVAAAAGDTPPGDDDARLVRVRVLGPDGQPRSSAAIDEAFAIEITFDVLRDGKNVQPAFRVKSQTDQVLFTGAYTDPDWLNEPPPVGRHVATAWVPAHLMNVGITYVTAVLVTPDPFEVHCTVERAVSLNLFERFGAAVGARGLFARELPGAVRPLLRWETHRGSLGAADSDMALGATVGPAGAT